MSAPRLLDKKTVNAEVAAQKKRQIDEGLTLAKKVDALRETLQTEQGNVERFRSMSIEQVKKEIDSYIRQKDSLLQDIHKRQKELEILNIPLTEEWEKIQEVHIKYDDKIKSLESSQQTVAQQLGENTMKAHELELEWGRIKDIKHRTSESLVEATNTLAHAQKEAKYMAAKAKVVFESVEAREKVVIFREEEVKSDIAWVESEKAKFATAEADIARREAVLKDRYAALERNLKRK